MDIDYKRKLDAFIPERGVLEIRNALVTGINGWIFSPQGHFMADHSWFGWHVNDITNMPERLPVGMPLAGLTLTLASDFAVQSYGHFVVDCLCRLDLFFKAGYTLSDVTSICCPKPTKGNAEVLFTQLGIPVEKCIWTDNDVPLRVENLVAPAFPGTRRNYPKWVAEYLKKTFIPNPSTPHRRLYVSRSGYARAPENEEAILRILMKYGFENYNPIEHVNSHLDFSEAEMVVGVSGSALTGVAFCQSGTKLLELVPSDHVFPYYYTLSTAAGMRYGYLVCQSIEERYSNSQGPSFSNIIVNEDDFEQALAAMVK